MKQGYSIRPSILTNSSSAAVKYLAWAKKMRTPVHFDLMDGIYTVNRSFGPSALARLNIPASSEAHLMVVHPLDWLAVLKKSAIGRVIIHASNRRELFINMAAFRSAGIKVGVVIDPRSIKSLLPSLPSRSWVHVMCGKIGSYGSKFDRRSILRIKTIRRYLPDSFISCDVGLNPSTIPAVFRAGANEIIVGSYVWQTPNPLSHWTELLDQRRSLSKIVV